MEKQLVPHILYTSSTGENQILDKLDLTYADAASRNDKLRLAGKSERWIVYQEKDVLDIGE